MEINDTIAAVSTPYGKGGIAVIRLSGSDSINISDMFFKTASGKSLDNYCPNSAVYGKIYYENYKIDDGVATVFRAPKSYTGENTVEISCHGGIKLSSMVLESAILCGARQAEAGEFTKRAFLNGKISLTQAESVIDLIDASTDEKIKIASAQSSGILSDKVSEITEKISDLLSEVYVINDYPDEDLSELTRDKYIESLLSVKNDLKSLCDSYKTGKAICEGINTAIIGKPNVGKSTLLNCLLRCDRAIVSNIPGTTRDTIEESVNLGKIVLRISDTAGIHPSENEIEKIGIERSKKSIEKSSLVLAVFDGSKPLDNDDLYIISILEKSDSIILPVVSKSDLDNYSIPSFPSSFDNPIIFSSKNSECLNILSDRINSYYVDEKIDYFKTPVLTNIRQFTAAKKAYDLIELSLCNLLKDFPIDMISLDVESAYSVLCNIDGRGTADDIANKIFHRFCVGK